MLNEYTPKASPYVIHLDWERYEITYDEARILLARVALLGELRT